mmetsp:Transcript_37864/g.45652  ORF Transcript_37864/g.45652 Transcript_37864/m.45652 type:complete len:299 (+) Transcript_37864:253-1149(+)|eukprot:CAMPEP_0197858930 /NCGR_PEP_ID=MMETSP1438-20131217/33099_1 /TAXON_ID=1461541 /ORGANISM="Pterosperma sp., Strain CCMP1384" /LENGTH=298 /DNA_ID=CAMNT_0043475241 /DNA_START=247 /DNA_END=1143 /DNA_ORIENTATION=-
MQTKVAKAAVAHADSTASEVCKGVEAEIEGESHFPISSLAISISYGIWIMRVVSPENETDRTAAWFQETSIMTPLVASFCYLCMCHFGKQYMMTREPFELKYPMLVYNLYQTVFNTLCIVYFVKEWRDNNMSIWGNRTDFGPKGFGMAQLIYLHYNNKYIELLDTTFMVLRKKFNQMSFLHMYHHVLLVWAWFITVRLDPGGDAYFGAGVNTFVHIVMYSYYFLSALKINCFWKKYITQLQLTQFVACGCNSIYCWYAGNHHPVLPYIELWVMTTMFYLFSQFYRNAYKKKQAAAKSA